MLAIDIDNPIYFPPNVFYLSCGKIHTVPLELCEAPVPSLSQGFQDTSTNLIKGSKTWSMFELLEQRSEYCVMGE